MTNAAAPFAEMADRIKANTEADFAGAFVVCPPEGEPITLLLLDNRKNPAVFWSMLKSHAEIALNEMAERERVQGWSGGRR